jgi:hypothetical protein
LYRQAVLELDTHRAKLGTVLGETADSIVRAFPTVIWHIEDALSRRYALKLLLVFVDQRSPDEELIVVDVSLRRGKVAAWTIDATRGDGTFIAEDLISESDGAQMAHADVAAHRLATFLTRCRPLMISVLSSQPGDIAAR